MKKYIVFSFHHDFEGMGLDENEILTRLHYRSNGKHVPMYMAAGHYPKELQLKGSEPLTHQKRTYSQVWMNKTFIVADISFNSLMADLSTYAGQFGGKDKLQEELNSCLNSWLNLQVGTRLFLPNPYYELMPNHFNNQSYLVGGERRIRYSELTTYQMMYFHAFLSRVWITTGDSHPEIPGMIASPNVGFFNYWSPNLVQVTKRLKRLAIESLIKFGPSGLSAFESGIPTLSPYPLNQFFSPRYLLNSEHPVLLRPHDFTSLDSLRAFGGPQIQHSSIVEKDEYRFSTTMNDKETSALVYDGYFVIKEEELLAMSGSGGEDVFYLSQDDIDFFSKDPKRRPNLKGSASMLPKTYPGQTNFGYHLEPDIQDTPKIYTKLTYDISKCNVSSLPMEYLQWLTNKNVWYPTPFPTTTFENETPHSRIFNKPLLFGRNNRPKNNIRPPEFAGSSQRADNQITLRTFDNSAYWSIY